MLCYRADLRNEVKNLLIRFTFLRNKKKAFKTEKLKIGFRKQLKTTSFELKKMSLTLRNDF